LLASRIRVRRLSYETAPAQIPTAVWEPLVEVTGRYRSRRLNAGAVELALPEVRIRVRDGEVELTPIDRSTSRQVVAEAMLMAGEAAARLARAEGLALPFISQEANSPEVDLPGLAGAYARRRGMKPSRVRSSPERHDGLGLDAYTRATSPLRRYSDLLVHQQLVAWRAGGEPMTREAVHERASVAEQAAGRVRRAERLSNRHWTLVYLMQNAGWRGSGVVVQVEERRTLLFIPKLALEYSVSSRKGLTLNQEVGLSRPQVDLPRLEASFRLD
jgi:exoribonuclease-2